MTQINLVRHYLNPLILVNSPISLIVNLVGADRPGLVNRLSHAITESGGNWESSRMVRLAGQFAGMVHVVIREEDVAALENRMETLRTDDGVQITLVKTGFEESPEAAATPFRLEVVGQDRPGIVSTISHTLATAGANVIELATDCTNAPWSGERLFKASATVMPPENVSADDLKNQIEAIATDLMVEIEDVAD